MMVPNSPGGGYDVTARTAVKITETTGITGPVQVFNLSGGGGTVALTRLMHETGNPDLLMMMGLGVIGATVTSRSDYRVTDATPIARLIEEQEGVMVPARLAVYASIAELMSAWRASPGQFTVGGGSQNGGPDHLMSMRLAGPSGSTPGRSTTSLMTAAANCYRRCSPTKFDFAASGVREYTEQIKSGQLRVLGGFGGSPRAECGRADLDRIRN